MTTVIVIGVLDLRATFRYGIKSASITQTDIFVKDRTQAAVSTRFDAEPGGLP